MDAWLGSALGYIDLWIEFQMRLTGQPGCVIAIGKSGDVVYERFLGVADLDTGEALTERHRFRVASHSKTFTAAGVLKLSELGRLRLDDAAGSFVKGLHPSIAAVSLKQLLVHGAGLSRDGDDAGFFVNQRPFLSVDELRAALQLPPPVEAGRRPKYSNLGFGLLGLVIESVTGEPYDSWMSREIIAPAGLTATTPDISEDAVWPQACGHTARLPLGRRRVLLETNAALGLAPAAGFVSTAGDLVRFYAQLSPTAKSSILSRESRWQMTQTLLPDPDAPDGRSYGLGVSCASSGSWVHFGHVGRFPGTISRTAMLSPIDVTVAVLTNAIDGSASLWLDGIIHILKAFADHGAPDTAAATWTGRWWSLWGATDFVAAGSTLRVFNPALHPPFFGASEISLTDADRGLVTKAPAAERFGEAVVRLRDNQGHIEAIRIGGQRLVSETAMQSVLESVARPSVA